MSDRDALLSAIIDNPAEDTPRLVFADWLDEHADGFPTPAAARSRAAFIRDDVLMSQRDEFDPARLRWELIDKPRRETGAWVKEVVPAVPTGCEFVRPGLFRRGFLWAMNLDRARHARPDQDWLSGLPIDGIPLERVRFISGAYHGVNELLRTSWSGRLSEIEFDGYGNTSPVRYHRLSALERLTRFVALKTAIGTAEFRELAASPLFARLTGLVITRSPVGSVVLQEVARAGAASALRELRLMGCRVSPTATAALFDSPASDRLETLALGGDRIGAPEKLRVVAEAAGLTRLRSLDLSSDSPSEAGLEAFLASPLVASLKRLDLSRCGLNRDRARLLASGTFGNLRVLCLSGNAVGNDGAAALARSPHLAGLLVLELSYSQVGDEGVEAILESPLADGLVLLDLTGSPASDETKQLLKARMGDRVRV